MLFSRGVIISGVIYFIGYYLNILAEKQKASIEIEQLKKEKLSAQLEELKQQMSPHFLFNSLNTLKTIVPDENSKTYIVKLANVYRYLLSFNSKHLTTLKDELDFVESYLYILKERFEDALEITIDIDESLMENYIPPLSLQLLIENAIKHNIVSMDDPLKINVTNNNSKDMLIISNNLQLKSSKENSTGMGLDNIKTRYQLLAQKDILISKNENSFSVQIPLLLNSHSPI
ncbi:MAG: histidine kinase [Vicingaceae bacterium]|nr:histidine kinase [Vicingaceae bacterium]